MASSYRPFDTANVLNFPDLNFDNETRWQGFQFDKNLDSAVFGLPEVEEKSLQDLQSGTFSLNVQEISVASLYASSASSYTTAEDDRGRELEQLDDDVQLEPGEDIWTLPEVKSGSRKPALTSWDHFLDRRYIEPGPAYLSEAGSPTFDAIVARSRAKAPLVLSDTFLHSLHSLALGRSSLLLQWNEKQRTFSQAMDDFTVSGYTPGLLQRLLESIASGGTIIRKLSTPEQYFRCPRSPSRSELAFASALRTCLAAVQQYMDDRRHGMNTILQVEQAGSSILPLLDLLAQLAGLVKDSPSDSRLLSSLIRRATDRGLLCSRFVQIFNLIISAVAQPLLQDMSSAIGLHGAHPIMQEELVPSEEDHWADVLPVEIYERLQDAAQTLKLLQHHHPERLVVHLSANASRPFELAFNWESLSAVQAEADEYEIQAVSTLLGGCRPNAAYDARPLLFPAGTPDSSKAFEFLDIGHLPPDAHLADTSMQAVLGCLATDLGTPEQFPIGYDEALTLSISPLLFAQHRLLSFSMFECLFRQHNLQSHLDIQHRIHLLGDGMFAARLSIALFDSSQSSGEDMRKIGATSGLRLQTRESWPPASSELRLVLMSVLSESMSVAGVKGLEDTISFAIRDLSDEELESCKDVDSIHALDFLKVHYRPPNNVLEAVISTESLGKYDNVFRHLLRILRLKSVAQGLLREVSSRRAISPHGLDHRFCIEIQSFVSTVADYSQTIAALRPWMKLESAVRGIGKRLDDADYEGVLQFGHSLSSLRERHETTLDEILRALLLKHKQKQALETLEQVFGVILKYAAATRRMTIDEPTTKRYHEEFRSLARHFVTLLRDAATRDEMRGGQGNGSDMFEELLTRIDWNGYWTR
jgi:Gamma tubulin complex component C-terminal